MCSSYKILTGIKVSLHPGKLLHFIDDCGTGDQNKGLGPGKWLQRGNRLRNKAESKSQIVTLLRNRQARKHGMMPCHPESFDQPGRSQAAAGHQALY